MENKKTKNGKNKIKTEPYSNISYGTEPTKWIKFMRVCISKQLFSFLKLNLKILKIVAYGHS